MIVKVQRSLTYPPQVLIYDKPRRDGQAETHEILTQLTIGHLDVVKILGDDLKGYFEARLIPGDGESTIEIGDRVPDEGW